MDKGEKMDFEVEEMQDLKKVAKVTFAHNSKSLQSEL